mmetsp:Transcript_21878/g.55710  ORF Transcript_21878/g.55710 Transcript_21878/m.55710 type:complete len:592 (-) Transcript_21878:26-1801(-)
MSSGRAVQQPMDSTVSLLYLWRLCVDSQDGREVDGSVLNWNTLRAALDNLPINRCESLRCRSGDDILHQYFGPRRTPVNFTRYWRGMEVILQTCDTFHCRGMDASTQQQVASLRRFRDSILESSESRVHGGTTHDSFSVNELRRRYEDLRRQAAAEGLGAAPVCDFWVARLRELPQHESVPVTLDDIASALLKWLEVLLKPLMRGPAGDDDDAEFDEELETDDDAASYSDEPEQEWAPPSATSARRHEGAAIAEAAAEVAALAGHLGSIAGTVAMQHRLGPASWLLVAAPNEPQEVCRFREQLVHRIGDGGPELTFGRLYRLMTDALSEDAAARGGGSSLSRATLRAGMERLAGVVRRQVRAAFRQMDSVLAVKALPGSAPERGGLGGEGLLVAELVKSQATSAVILERRKDAIPWAYRLATLLERARRRNLHGALSIWRPPRSHRDGLQPLSDAMPPGDDQEHRVAHSPSPGGGAPSSSPPHGRASASALLGGASSAGALPWKRDGARPSAVAGASPGRAGGSPAPRSPGLGAHARGAAAQGSGGPPGMGGYPHRVPAQPSQSAQPLPQQQAASRGASAGGRRCQEPARG